MRKIIIVFIALIGMISTTAFATTSKLDQEQKTEFSLEQLLPVNDVNVEITNVLTNFNVLHEFRNESFVIKSQNSKKLNIINDFGLSSGKQNKIPYKEKLEAKKDFVHPLFQTCRSNC